MKEQIIGLFPGISCAWVDAGGKVSAEYYGFADKENHIPADEGTIFPACSISKFITAICVMRLHEQKLIDIDMPVNKCMRQWKLRTADGVESNASIRSIMCHTAGILDGDDSFYGLRRGEPEVSLTDILEGKTSYNNRPARAEKLPGTTFEYSDVGYCILQLLVQEVMHKPFDGVTRELLFDPLGLRSTFFATSANIARFEDRMATGYDDSGLPIPGRFPQVPDLAASGLWSTPQELLTIAKEFVKALNDKSSFLEQDSAWEMAKPVKDFPWTGLGIFTSGEDILVSQGWGENGQCMMKMNYRTGEIAVVMTNRNPGVDQTESGVEWLADRIFNVE